MSGRYRTVALQVVGVAVLAAFVFVAFLRPSEPGDLSGIDAPGSGDGPTVVDPPDDGKGKRDRKGRDQGTGNGSNGARSGGNVGRGSGPSSELDDGDSSTTPDTGPDDDQYTDLVTTLMKQVGEPGLYKEIDDP